MKWRMLERLKDIDIIKVSLGSIGLNVWAWFEPNEWNVWIAFITGILVLFLTLRKVLMYIVRDVRKWKRGDMWDD